MSPELEQKLFDEFPLLFRGRSKPATESLMRYGLEHGDGWYQIIYVMCKCIDSYVKEKNIDYEFIQIKEKFGTLRIYDNGGDDFIKTIISMVEFMSSVICEVTGRPGKLYCSSSSSWFKTLCKEEAEKNGYVPAKITKF